MSFISFSILVIPFFLAPPMAAALVKLLSFTNYDLNARKLTNPIEIESYVFSLLQAIGYQDLKDGHQSARMSMTNFGASDCYLLAMLNSHMQHCESSDCICIELEVHSLDSSKANQARKSWLLFAKEQLGEFLQKYPNNPQFHIIAACVEYSWLGNIFLTLDHLTRAYALRPSIPAITTILHIYRKIEKDMIAGNFVGNSRSSEATELIEIIKTDTFLKLFNKFIKKMENCTVDSIEFWSILIKDTPDAEHLNSIGNKIFECMKELRGLYYRILGCDPENLNFLCMYGIFLKYVVFDEINSSKILARVKTLKDNRVVNKKFHRSFFWSKKSKTILLKVSGNQETFGKILDVNLEATLELKYSRKEFKRINITKLMLPFIATKHSEWVKRAFASMDLGSIGKVIGAFVSDKDGYYFYANVEVRLIPNLKEGITFILFIWPNRKLTGYLNQVGHSAEIKKQYYLLLCDEKENVVGINNNAGKLFSILPNAINPEITLQTLIPELENKEVREAVKSNGGYRCAIDVTHIERTLGDSDKVQDDSSEENTNKLPVWMKLIENAYGEKHNLPSKQIIFVLYPTPVPVVRSIRTLERKVQATGAEIGDGSDDNFDEKQLAEFTENHSASAASSHTSNISNRNLAKELKASLYDKKIPFSVKVFIYTIWIIYIMLLTACVIDWVVSYIKAYDAGNLFNTLDHITQRLTVMLTSTRDSRTLDLIIRELEDNLYYGDEFYERINKRVI